MCKIRRYFIVLLSGLSLLTVSLYGIASASPEGYWLTISDDNHAPQGIIKIGKDASGALVGRVLGGFTKKGAQDHPNCNQCSSATYEVHSGYGLKKNAPIIGKVVMWGYTKDGDAWAGGSIVDTTTGKKYRSSIALSRQGGVYDPNSLGVTGKLLFFSKTEYWTRIKNIKDVYKLCKKNSTPGFIVRCDIKYSNKSK